MVSSAPQLFAGSSPVQQMIFQTKIVEFWKSTNLGMVEKWNYCWFLLLLFCVFMTVSVMCFFCVIQVKISAAASLQTNCQHQNLKNFNPPNLLSASNPRKTTMEPQKLVVCRMIPPLPRCYFLGVPAVGFPGAPHLQRWSHWMLRPRRCCLWRVWRFKSVLERWDLVNLYQFPGYLGLPFKKKTQWKRPSPKKDNNNKKKVPEMLLLFVHIASGTFPNSDFSLKHSSYASDLVVQWDDLRSLKISIHKHLYVEVPNSRFGSKAGHPSKAWAITGTWLAIHIRWSLKSWSLSNEVSILLNCIVGRRSYFFLAFYECILGLSFAPASQTYWRRVMQKQPKSLEICSAFYYQLFQAHPCLCQIWNHLKTSAVLATKKRWGGGSCVKMAMSTWLLVKVVTAGMWNGWHSWCI